MTTHKIILVVRVVKNTSKLAVTARDEVINSEDEGSLLVNIDNTERGIVHDPNDEGQGLKSKSPSR